MVSWRVGDAGDGSRRAGTMRRVVLRIVVGVSTTCFIVAAAWLAAPVANRATPVATEDEFMRSGWEDWRPSDFDTVHYSKYLEGDRRVETSGRLLIDVSAPEIVVRVRDEDFDSAITQRLAYRGGSPLLRPDLWIEGSGDKLDGDQIADGRLGRGEVRGLGCGSLRERKCSKWVFWLLNEGGTRAIEVDGKWRVDIDQETAIALASTILAP